MTGLRQEAGGLRRLARRPADLARRLNAARHRMAYLGIASVLETTVVPIAIELVLVPFMLANPGRIWTIATVTLIGCLIGASAGYLLGLLLFDTAGLWVIRTLDLGAAYDGFAERFAQHGFAAILLVAITPIPFQVAMLAAGAADYPFALFMLACVIARGARYYGLAGLVLLAGPRATDWLARGGGAGRLAAVTAVVAIVILVFALV